MADVSPKQAHYMSQLYMHTDYLEDSNKITTFISARKVPLDRGFTLPTALLILKVQERFPVLNCLIKKDKQKFKQVKRVNGTELLYLVS